MQSEYLITGPHPFLQALSGVEPCNFCRPRIAAQDYVPPKKRAPAKRKQEPRFQWGKSATKRAAARGVLV